MHSYIADTNEGVDMTNLFSASGRELSAPPEIKTTSVRSARKTLREREHWLLTEAIKEAEKNNDSWNLELFRGIDTTYRDRDGCFLTICDSDLLHSYLFGVV